ncbi:MAG TPA: dicarboxylate/amino acid:cation symporter [Gemmatimonadaceae bacterium]|nr:dicarboxylate/amino acid:cation symporter [Gemmatimonadaceae bacterium]
MTYSAAPGTFNQNAPESRRRGIRRISLTQWILISMVVGILLGWLYPESARDTHGWAATDLNVLSTVFLRMIKSLIVPLLFGTLVVGIAGHGDDMKRVGKLALRSIIYFEVITTLALVVGLVTVNLVKPGRGVDLGAASAAEGTQLASTHATIGSVLEHTVPQSFFEAATRNEVLQIVFFSIIFAVALSQVKQDRAKTFMLSACESLSEVMFKFTGIVMKFAPIGIGAAIAVTISKSGLGVLRNLGMLVLSLYGALIAFVVLVLVPVMIIARVPVRRFLRAVREPWLIAFTTASSEAALPLAMERMEELGVPRRIVAFVLPTGYSFNLDGSTLYLALASVFAAQAAGIDMPISTQLVMMLTLMLTSKGVAAVPRAALVILSGALTDFHLPLQAVAVILGVDALMDMARTSINLFGNCLATVVMARWDGEFDRPSASTPVADAIAGRRLEAPAVETPVG